MLSDAINLWFIKLVSNKIELQYRLVAVKKLFSFKGEVSFYPENVPPREQGYGNHLAAAL